MFPREGAVHRRSTHDWYVTFHGHVCVWPPWISSRFRCWQRECPWPGLFVSSEDCEAKCSVWFFSDASDLSSNCLGFANSEGIVQASRIVPGQQFWRKTISKWNPLRRPIVQHFSLNSQLFKGRFLISSAASTSVMSASRWLEDSKIQNGSLSWVLMLLELRCHYEPQTLS